MKYSNIVNDIIIESRLVDKAYPYRAPLVINGVKVSTPNTAQNFIDVGWKLYDIPIISGIQRRGDIIVSIDSYTYEVIDKTQEELDTAVTVEASREMSYEMYRVLSWLKDEGVITQTNIQNAPTGMKNAFLAWIELEQ